MKLCIAEYGDTLPDDEIHKMGLRLLNLFGLLLTPNSRDRAPSVTRHEFEGPYFYARPYTMNRGPHLCERLPGLSGFDPLVQVFAF